MTDREKLLKLLESVEHARRLYPDLYVDMLIANGVVVREKGEWVQRTGYVDCNRCGCFQQKPHNFCPFCGADMRKGEDE